MFWMLLDEAATEPAASGGNNWINYVLIAVLLIAIILMFTLSGRKNKQSQKEYAEAIEAIKPGNKVKTAGGICGIVTEICEEDGTFVIKTGSEASGYSFVKMDKSMINETDAKGPTQILREEVEAKRKAEKEGKKLPKEKPAEEEAPVEGKTEE